MKTVLGFVLGLLSHAHSAGEVVVEDVIKAVQDAQQVLSLEPGASCTLAPINVDEAGNRYAVAITVTRDPAAA